MNRFLRSMWIVLATGLLWMEVSPAWADLEVSASVRISARADFYEPLSPHGAWIEADSYGRCWRPAHVAVEWRPYCDGHWVWTDCGWYWVSDEPWAWACYHYGSWVYHPRHAWIWIPDVEWGPAWVSWRIGGGYIGWAPLPPPHLRIVAPPFVFIETRRFREPVRRATVIVNNTTIINKTTVISNIRRENRNLGGARTQKVVINEGPGLEPIRRATGEQIRATPIQEVARQTAVPAAVERRSREGKGKEQPSAVPERATPTPERKTPTLPSPNADTPTSVIPPDQGRAPAKDRVAPPPVQPPAPEPKTPGSPRQRPELPKPVAPDKAKSPNKDEVVPPPAPSPAPAPPPGRPSQKPPKDKGDGRGHEKDRS